MAVKRKKKILGVEDIDKGFDSILDGLLAMDKAEQRIGWNSGKPKYKPPRRRRRRGDDDGRAKQQGAGKPRRRKAEPGPPAVAKVAGIQYGFRRMGQWFDRNQAAIDKRMAKTHALISNGAPPVKTMIDMGDWLAELLLRDVKRFVKKETGTLFGEIQALTKARVGPKARLRTFKGRKVGAA